MYQNPQFYCHHFVPCCIYLLSSFRPSLDAGALPLQTAHHSITDQVAHVAFSEAACLSGAVQVDDCSPQFLGRIIIQLYPPLVNVCFDGWI